MFKGLVFLCKFGWNAEKKYVIYNVLNQFVNSVTPLIAVMMPKYIIDELMGAQRTERLCFYVGVLVGVAFLAACASKFFTYAGFSCRIQVGNAFERMIDRKIAEVDFEKLESPAFWEQKRKAEKFIYADWHGFSYLLDSALDVVGKLITLIGIAAIVAALNPWMVLLLASLVLFGAAVDGWAKKNGTRLSMECVQYERGFSYFSGLFAKPEYGKEIRLYRLGDWLLARLSGFGGRMEACYRQRNGFYIKSASVSAFLSLVQQLAAYAYLIARVTAGTMAIGDFTMYAAAVTAFSGAMRAVAENLADVAAYAPYYEAVEAYLQMPDDMRKNRRLPAPQVPHKIEFCSVSFRYPGQSCDALHDVSFTLSGGEKLAVVGENGAGKTTFIKLLMRLYDPTAGTILLDGADIRDIAYEEYLALFSTVFQDYRLFAFSLKENVCFDKKASDAEIETILRRVGLGERLDALPKGVHTALYKEFDAQGFEPSGGEGQRIALARALYKDAPIVVLDEPTAALDPKAEYEIYRRFDELTAGKTAVYISHRLSSAKFCDRILVLDSGSVAETGTHDSLMRENGIFARLFSMQAQYYA